SGDHAITMMGGTGVDVSFRGVPPFASTTYRSSPTDVVRMNEIRVPSSEYAGYRSVASAAGWTIVFVSPVTESTAAMLPLVSTIAGRPCWAGRNGGGTGRREATVRTAPSANATSKPNRSRYVAVRRTGTGRIVSSIGSHLSGSSQVGRGRTFEVRAIVRSNR